MATLEAGIGFLFHFVFAAIYLLVWGMDIVKGFSTFSATVLALTFVFGNSVRCAACGMHQIAVAYRLFVVPLLWCLCALAWWRAAHTLGCPSQHRRLRSPSCSATA